jgi:hypothetical protein
MHPAGRAERPVLPGPWPGPQNRRPLAGALLAGAGAARGNRSYARAHYTRAHFLYYAGVVAPGTYR